MPRFVSQTALRKIIHIDCDCFYAAIEMRDAEDEVYRAAEELGIDLSHAEPSSVEEV